MSAMRRQAALRQDENLPAGALKDQVGVREAGGGLVAPSLAVGRLGTTPSRAGLPSLAHRAAWNAGRGASPAGGDGARRAGGWWRQAAPASKSSRAAVASPHPLGGSHRRRVLPMQAAPVFQPTSCGEHQLASPFAPRHPLHQLPPSPGQLPLPRSLLLAGAGMLGPASPLQELLAALQNRHYKEATQALPEVQAALQEGCREPFQM